MKQLKGIDLVAGMVIITENGYRYVVFPVNITNQKFAFANITKGGWTSRIKENNIIEIKTPPESDIINSGVTIWKRSCELTMKEIAEKFGIPVEELRIKKE